jgi:exopolysaccharide biosynthesis protein
MAAGIDERGTLSLVAVEGRDFQHALGLTLGALSELMIGLGCTRAMNLDGGSSKRMIVSGRQVDRSSTEVLQSRDPAPQRPVRSAVFFWS